MKILKKSLLFVLLFSVKTLLSTSEIAPENTTSVQTEMAKPEDETKQYQYLKSLIYPTPRHQGWVEFLLAIPSIPARAGIIYFMQNFFWKKGEIPVQTKWAVLLYFEHQFARWLETWMLKEQADMYTNLNYFGGTPHTIMYLIYHKFAFTNYKCLDKTLKAFAKKPDLFPKAAQALLKEKKPDIKKMKKTEINLLCWQLRALKPVEIKPIETNPTENQTDKSK